MGLARWPEVFVVGAPRCGTGSLYAYLSSHPNLFVSKPKEPNFFATDLTDTRAVRDEDEYLKLFAQASQDQLLVDASIWQLYSTAAAQRLASLPHQPKILVQLRNPLAMLPSVHAKHVAVGFEPITNFEAAYYANRLPNRKDFRMSLDYSKVARFGEQLDRYYQFFDRDHIKVTLFDDFVGDPDGTYRSILAFLGVEEISLDTYEQHNASHPVRSPLLARSAGTLRRITQEMKSGPLRRVARRGAGLLERLGGVAEQRPLSDNLRSRIIEDLADDPDRLSKMIGRDLNWFQRVTRAA